MCAIGPAYFYGVKWAAGLTSLGCFGYGFFCFRSACKVTDSKSINTHWPKARMLTANYCGFSLIGALQLVKFIGARGRYNEFLWDDFITDEEAQDRILSGAAPLPPVPPIEHSNQLIAPMPQNVDDIPEPLSFRDGILAGLFGTWDQALNPCLPGEKRREDNERLPRSFTRGTK
jgi:hypothetical protein